jgi:hypothetical protein
MKFWLVRSCLIDRLLLAEAFLVEAKLQKKSFLHSCGFPSSAHCLKCLMDERSRQPNTACIQVSGAGVEKLLLELCLFQGA